VWEEPPAALDRRFYFSLPGPVTLTLSRSTMPLTGRKGALSDTRLAVTEHRDLKTMVDELAVRLESMQSAPPANGGGHQETVESLRPAVEELKAAQEELLATRAAAEELHARYLDLFEFAPDGYVVSNPHGSVIEANRAACALLNRSGPRLIGKPLPIFVHREDRTCLRAQLIRMRETERAELTLRLLPLNLPEIVAHLTLGAVRGRDGSLHSIRWMFRDVTDHHRIEHALRTSREQVRAMASRLVLVEEQERRRIATEIHDHISQSLAVAKLRLGMLREALGGEHLTALDETRELLSHVAAQTRTLTFELSPAILYELGLGAAIEWLIEQRSGFGVTFDFINDAPRPRLRRELEITLFRAVRELLANVIKHAKATRARVTLREDSRHVVIEVADDGIGFDPGQRPTRPSRDGSLGLFSLNERLAHLRGRVEIDSAPGRGACVRLIAPLHRLHRRKRKTANTGQQECTSMS